MISLAICIPTYKRNRELAELLDALAVQAVPPEDEAKVRVLVIDNNPGADAASVVADAALRHPRLAIAHVHEAQPGVTFVRNRALAETREEDLLVFIDDDELPDVGWLLALWSRWRESGAGVVFGTVEALYDASPPAWLREGDFHSKRVLADGPRPKPGATDNCLIDLSVVRRHGLEFDPALSLIGGEDTLFFDALLLKGERFENAASARTFERIPENRARLGWLLTRWRRTGLTDAMMLARRRGGGGATRWLAGLEGSMRVAAGGMLAGLSHLLAGGRMHPRTVRRLYTYQRGLGMIDYFAGRDVKEYGR